MKSWNPLRRTNSDQRCFAIEAGQVVCPHRGVVDVEDCWICPAYRGLSSGPSEGLLCAPERTILSNVGRMNSYPAWILKR